MTIASQLVTIGAVLVGAAASYAATTMAELGRFRRDLRIRWVERRLNSYADYIITVKKVVRISRELFVARISSIENDNLVQMLGQLSVAEAERSTEFERLVLIGDADTVSAAHTLNERVWRLVRVARGSSETEVSEADWFKNRDEWLAALINFHRVARISIGIADPPEAEALLYRDQPLAY
jgi:hypothetical protein